MAFKEKNYVTLNLMAATYLRQDALRESKPPPRQLMLWAIFTFKGLLLYFVYIYFVFLVCLFLNIL